jgi:hypothetical protein
LALVAPRGWAEGLLTLLSELCESSASSALKRGRQGGIGEHGVELVPKVCDAVAHPPPGGNRCFGKVPRFRG